MKLSQINPKNIKGFIQAKHREVLDSFGELPKYIKEQSQWRLNQVRIKSPKCYEEDKCVHCGCQVSSKVLEQRACSNNGFCYPEMMNEADWNLFKINFEIEMFALWGTKISFNQHYNIDE